MKYDSDEALADELSRVGRAISPRPDGLRAVLKGEVRQGGLVQSPLLLVTSYMSLYTKLGTTLVAILVVAGGVYYAATPGTTNVALETGESTTMAMVADDSSARVAAVQPTPATDSIDDLAAALAAEAAADNAGIAAFDASVDSEVTAMNELSSTNDMGYVDSI